MTEQLDDFYLKKEEPNKSCLLALRQIILNQNCGIYETQKYGMPCFCIHKKILCYLWTDKKTNEPYILFVEGKKINHLMLVSDNRAKMKVFKLNPNEDLPLETIKQILKMAIDLIY